jgi:putative addiction module component (TIGR02574 family)
MNKTESIVQEASQLARHERVEIIEKLLETLEPDAIENPSIVNSAWRDELQRRSSDIRSGRVETIAWDQVKEEGEKSFDGD